VNPESREVVVCDLDGTLLGPDALLSGFAREGLSALLGAGIPLTVATSRRIHSIRKLLDGIPLVLPVIEVNGAFITEFAGGRRLVANFLDPGAAALTVEAMIEAGADPVVTAWDGSRDQVHFRSVLNQGSAWFVEGKRRFAEVTDLIEADEIALGDGVAAVTGFLPDAAAADFASRLAAALGPEAAIYAAANFYCPGWTEVQVQDSVAEKGAAIPELLELASLEGRQVLACGDHLNDLGLLEAADLAVAPANAHPQVRELADVVVASNREDGVVRYLLDRYGRSIGFGGDSAGQI
jgi:hydroxymethylpyrimidine pyrophosphatase-like HAD family hydrolase